ncbi:glycosyltransferase [Acaryochloris sp. 'Moss Beach']|uniref:glycosyltransferase family 4 protein n=1 Tax=Acaryochloris sp. 'Moss Beach' TaxID=2740837 RepID=UPI001F283249|nr:glycosyltransferase [Acaryochloris sp. 'Moss Beach']UJB69823.1 glycosyltransferase [Acaryochloris sp. 'Moss Beach']
MRILIAGILAGQGGIQSHIRWLAKALGEEGIEVLVLSLGTSKSLPIDESFLKQSWNNNVQLRFCAAYQTTTSNRNLGGLRRLQEIVEIIDEFDPDIYLAIGTGWNLFIPPLLSKAKPIRIFHEVMSGVPNGWQDSRWCVKLWFDEVIGQATPVSQAFSKEFGWKKEVSTLPAFPEPLEITANLPEVTAIKVTKGKVKAALFSRLAPHKQAFWLVQQWSKLKEYLSELHIHGSGSDEDLIRSYIAKAGIGKEVKCLGRYPEGQAYVDLLSSYDLTLLPTIGAEGAPLVLLESMACGVPFLAYGVGGIPDYGRNNPDVRVVAPDDIRFFEGLEQITSAFTKGEIDQRRLQRFYFEHYSYEALKISWLNYLKAIYQQKQHNVAMPLMH